MPLLDAGDQFPDLTISQPEGVSSALPQAAADAHSAYLHSAGLLSAVARAG